MKPTVRAGVNCKNPEHWDQDRELSNKDIKKYQHQECQWIFLKKPEALSYPYVTVAGRSFI